MIDILKTLLGFLFFSLLFGVLMVKHQPNAYEVSLHKEVPYPVISYSNELNKNLTRTYRELGNQIQLPLLKDWIVTEIPRNDELKSDNISLLLNTDKYFSIDERWIFSNPPTTIELNYSYQVDFLSKMYLLFNPNFFREIKTLCLHRMAQLEKSIEDQYQQHRYRYVGEVEQPPTYYIMIEGESNWDNLTSKIHQGHQEVLLFMKNKNIPVTKLPFIVYPSIREDLIRWRAAVPTDQYYQTLDDKIKCRRYKGGKNLALIHKGTPTHLNKSWEVLMDSLDNKTQSYPAIQYNIAKQPTEDDPLDRENLLLIPIN